MLGAAVALLGVGTWHAETIGPLPPFWWTPLPVALVVAWFLRPRQATIADALELSEPFIVLDASGRVTHANDRAFALFRITRRDPTILRERLAAIPALRQLLSDPSADSGEFFLSEVGRGPRCYEIFVKRDYEPPPLRVVPDPGCVALEP